MNKAIYTVHLQELLSNGNPSHEAVVHSFCAALSTSRVLSTLSTIYFSTQQPHSVTLHGWPLNC